MAEHNPIERNVLANYENLCENMKERIPEIYKLFRGESHGDKSPFIRRFPQIPYNTRAIPRVVSIGPHNRGNFRYQEMEMFKWQCLEYSLVRRGKNLGYFVEKIRPLEREARECYSEPSALETDEFLVTMVLDGFFIEELIRFSNSRSFMKSHPLARMERANLPKICADLLMIQNQIPYKVLEQVFEASKLEGETQSVEFFSAILGFRYRPNRKLPEVQWMHLLDLVRSIFIPSDHEWSSGAEGTSHEIQIPLEYQYRPLETIPCVTKLRRVGIKVRPRRENGLGVNFHLGVIEMPKIILNDLMCSFLENCVILEQRHNDRSKHCSVYALCLDCLVNTASDVEYLIERRVIENYLETDEKAAKFFNNLGKGLTFDWDYRDFFTLCDRVNDYRENTWRQYLTSFKGEYFERPWLWISVLTAFVLLVLTFLQTYYSIHAYVYPKN